MIGLSQVINDNREQLSKQKMKKKKNPPQIEALQQAALRMEFQEILAHIRRIAGFYCYRSLDRSPEQIFRNFKLIIGEG